MTYVAEALRGSRYIAACDAPPLAVRRRAVEDARSRLREGVARQFVRDAKILRIADARANAATPALWRPSAALPRRPTNTRERDGEPASAHRRRREVKQSDRSSARAKGPRFESAGFDRLAGSRASVNEPVAWSRLGLRSAVLQGSLPAGTVGAQRQSRSATHLSTRSPAASRAGPRRPRARSHDKPRIRDMASSLRGPPLIDADGHASGRCGDDSGPATGRPTRCNCSSTSASSSQRLTRPSGEQAKNNSLDRKDAPGAAARRPLCRTA